MVKILKNNTFWYPFFFLEEKVVYFYVAPFTQLLTCTHRCAQGHFSRQQLTSWQPMKAVALYRKAAVSARKKKTFQGLTVMRNLIFTYCSYEQDVWLGIKKRGSRWPFSCCSCVVSRATSHQLAHTTPHKRLFGGTPYHCTCLRSHISLGVCVRWMCQKYSKAFNVMQRLLTGCS